MSFEISGLAPKIGAKKTPPIYWRQKLRQFSFWRQKLRQFFGAKNSANPFYEMRTRDFGRQAGNESLLCLYTHLEVLGPLFGFDVRG